MNLFSHEFDQGLPQTTETRDEGEAVQASLKERVNSYERKIVMETVDASRSIREAARRLGLSHTAILKKLKKWKQKGPLETI